ncbi:MAG: hypothetical protein JRM77_06990 [Nitrososphaerota archaeon]|nr:hypothetical protein [Nitrososphaerota archaeon]
MGKDERLFSRGGYLRCQSCGGSYPPKRDEHGHPYCPSCGRLMSGP